VSGFSSIGGISTFGSAVYLLAYKLYSEVAGDENLQRVKNHPRMSSIVIMAGLRTWKKHIYDIGLSWMKIYNV